MVSCRAPPLRLGSLVDKRRAHLPQLPQSLHQDLHLSSTST